MRHKNHHSKLPRLNMMILMVPSNSLQRWKDIFRSPSNMSTCAFTFLATCRSFYCSFHLLLFSLLNQINSNKSFKATRVSLNSNVLSFHYQIQRESLNRNRDMNFAITRAKSGKTFSGSQTMLKGSIVTVVFIPTRTSPSMLDESEKSLRSKKIPARILFRELQLQVSRGTSLMNIDQRLVKVTYRVYFF